MISKTKVKSDRPFGVHTILETVRYCPLAGLAIIQGFKGKESPLNKYKQAIGNEVHRLFEINPLLAPEILERNMSSMSLEDRFNLNTEQEILTPEGDFIIPEKTKLHTNLCSIRSSLTTSRQSRTLRINPRLSLVNIPFRTAYNNYSALPHLGKLGRDGCAELLSYWGANGIEDRNKKIVSSGFVGAPDHVFSFRHPKIPEMGKQVVAEFKTYGPGFNHDINRLQVELYMHMLDEKNKSEGNLNISVEGCLLYQGLTMPKTASGSKSQSQEHSKLFPIYPNKKNIELAIKARSDLIKVINNDYDTNFFERDCKKDESYCKKIRCPHAEACYGDKSLEYIKRCKSSRSKLYNTKIIA